jgi:beta-mannosidase
LVILPRKSQLVQTLSLSKLIGEYGIRNLMVWTDIIVDREIVSSNYIAFTKPKHMELTDPQISYTVKEGGKGRAVVTFTAKAPALYCWLELEGIDARFSDNYFHIAPGNAVSVIIVTDKPFNIAEIKSKLRVRSLIDTYR